MKCFNHPETDAVGICKSCNKGICKDCLAEIENGIACKNKCEEEVKFINEMITRNKSIYKKTGAIYNRSALIYLFIAVVFFGTSISLDRTRVMTIPIGVVFILGAVFQFVNAKKVVNKE